MRRSTATTMLVATLLTAGCGGGPPDATSTAAPPPATSTTTPATGSATGAGAGATPPPPSFNPTDVAWLQLTVAMTERLLPVLDLVPGRTTDPAWRRLAAQVADAGRADLERAHRLLVEANAPATNPHEGHDMPGMVTAGQLTALRSARGEQFHRLLAGHLRAHLAQSVRVAAAEQRSGAHPATVTLAATVTQVSKNHLTHLNQLTPPPPPPHPPPPPPRPVDHEVIAFRRGVS
ncbi:DUF305 domain-containing protein [Micromonospora sp. WMMD1120]|uniref:DUF305 domain-containing protein n=1 Tax=Micromonospora sp. WMMD1120 TaxID=3016106 RepID=UPI002416A36A|nr:DUF305 domain-containing protein [Micromonospora sp. WMMD1120]MDG4810624.1 DUF305 domain-containing protein [Micromonospora sp. WMMD1120]